MRNVKTYDLTLPIFYNLKGFKMYLKKPGIDDVSLLLKFMGLGVRLCPGVRLRSKVRPILHSNLKILNWLKIGPI